MSVCRNEGTVSCILSFSKRFRFHAQVSFSCEVYRICEVQAFNPEWMTRGVPSGFQPGELNGALVLGPKLKSEHLGVCPSNEIDVLFATLEVNISVFN